MSIRYQRRKRTLILNASHNNGYKGPATFNVHSYLQLMSVMRHFLLVVTIQ
jgi:hypothetical protein